MSMQFNFLIKRFYFPFFAFLVFFTFCVAAENIPTAEQIKYFQQLPKNQQSALMAQYGLNVENFNSSSEAKKLNNVHTIQNRDVSFNEKFQYKDKLTPEKLSRFGLSLFSGFPSTFNPLDNVPVPSDYVIGPGDEIIIQLYGKQNEEYRLKVQRDGKILFPSLGAISVIGMNFSQMEKFLSVRIKEQIIGVRSNISLGELRSIQIFVLGDSYKPGSYSVSSLTTISQAIYLSGGFSETGSLRNVQLRRNGKLIHTLDMYDFLLKGNTKNDLRLQSGDAIFIAPVNNIVSIRGEVNRPGIYEIKSSENLREIIKMAGGLTPNALIKNARINRKSQNGLSKIVTVNLSNSQKIKIVNGDDIHVLTRGNSLHQYVNIQGDVINSGLVEWKRGLRISDVFPSIKSSFHETTDLDYGLIVRKIGVQQSIKIIQFNIVNAVQNPKSKDNIKLNSRDKILIFNRYELADIKENKKVVKTFEQAQVQSNKEKQQADEILSDEISISTEKLELITRNQEFTQEQIERIKLTSRKVLLTPLLFQLQQQSTFEKPAPIAEIRGEVKSPGRYPLADGARVDDLIKAAGGLTDKAFISNAELGRTITNSSQQAQLKTTQFHLGEALQNKITSNLLLMPNDKLNILQKPGSNQLQTTVILKGEVRFPGVYTVSLGETLSELIVRAGGLTEYADPEGAIFTREAIRLQEGKLLRDYADGLRQETAKKAINNDLLGDPSKTLALIEEVSKSQALGRMVLQLKDVIDKKPSADFMLEDGDFLFVPRFKNSISVMGEVQVAVTYMLDKSLTVQDYINKAGGLKKQADEDRIFVIRSDGSVFKPRRNFWFTRSSKKLKAGDTIIVPLNTNYRDPLSVWESATRILYQTGIAINAIK